MQGASPLHHHTTVCFQGRNSPVENCFPRASGHMRNPSRARISVCERAIFRPFIATLSAACLRSAVSAAIFATRYRPRLRQRQHARFRQQECQRVSQRAWRGDKNRSDCSNRSARAYGSEAPHPRSGTRRRSRFHRHAHRCAERASAAQETKAEALASPFFFCFAPPSAFAFTRTLARCSAPPSPGFTPNACFNAVRARVFSISLTCGSRDLRHKLY